jgi:hypothetical protein
MPDCLRCGPRFVTFPNPTSLCTFGYPWAVIGNPAWAMTDLVNLF